jgi:hypothetical protein
VVFTPIEINSLLTIQAAINARNRPGREILILRRFEELSDTETVGPPNIRRTTERKAIRPRTEASEDGS